MFFHHFAVSQLTESASDSNSSVEHNMVVQLGVTPNLTLYWLWGFGNLDGCAPK